MSVADLNRSRPPKRQEVALEPAVVRRRRSAGAPADMDDGVDPAALTPPLNPSPPCHNRRRGKRYADVPDMTPEEHRQRGDASQALWHELVRRATIGNERADE